MRTRFTILIGLVLALALVATACGSDDTGEETTTTTEAATTTTTEATTTTTEAATTTTAAAEAIDLVVWAESSVGFDLEDRPEELDRLASLSEAVGAPILVNVDTFRRVGMEPPPREWNFETFERIGKEFVRRANPPGERQTN